MGYNFENIENTETWKYRIKVNCIKLIKLIINRYFCHLEKQLTKESFVGWTGSTGCCTLSHEITTLQHFSLTIIKNIKFCSLQLLTVASESGVNIRNTTQYNTLKFNSTTNYILQNDNEVESQAGTTDSPILHMAHRPDFRQGHSTRHYGKMQEFSHDPHHFSWYCALIKLPHSKLGAFRGVPGKLTFFSFGNQPFLLKENTSLKCKSWQCQLIANGDHEMQLNHFLLNKNFVLKFQHKKQTNTWQGDNSQFVTIAYYVAA